MVSPKEDPSSSFVVVFLQDLFSSLCPSPTTLFPDPSNLWTPQANLENLLIGNPPPLKDFSLSHDD